MTAKIGEEVQRQQLGAPIRTFEELAAHMGRTVIVDQSTQNQACFVRAEIVDGSKDSKDPTVCYITKESERRRKDYNIIRPYVLTDAKKRGHALFFEDPAAAETQQIAENAAISRQEGALPGSVRTLEEIKISIRVHSTMAAESILQIGRDLIEAKALAGHGGWLPFLQEIGFKPSTAENWMRLAREVEPGSALSRLPYSKALALLSLPPEEREDFARENGAEEKSTAEIRRLIAERDKAAEAANAETNRANAAEAAALEAQKELEQAGQTADYYKAQAGQIEKERQDAERRAQELARELEKVQDTPVQIKTVEVPVETLPPDYEQLKQRAKWADQNVDDAMRAAMDAEKRAREAEAELDRLRLSQPQESPRGGIEELTEAVNAFIGAVQLMGVNPGPLAGRKREFDAIMKRMKLCVIDLEKAVDNAEWAAEGAVV